MISIGFRGSPDAVHYALVADDADASLVRTVSAVVMPLALHLPSPARLFDCCRRAAAVG